MVRSEYSFLFVEFVYLDLPVSAFASNVENVRGSFKQSMHFYICDSGYLSHTMATPSYLCSRQKCNFLSLFITKTNGNVSGFVHMHL